MKIAASIFKTLFLCLCIIANTHLAYAQTASILPQGKTQFLDNNGKPLTSGTVDFYIPSTTTRKTTWQNSAETVANSNPVVLDAGGRAIIYGDGSYRQVVKDRLGNVIWDQVTSSTGSGSGGSTATGDGDLVGTIKPWAGMTAPNQYVFTYGQEISRTTYSALFTAITSSQSVFCTSGSPTLTGLSDTTNFWVGASVEVSCLAAGFSTIISKTSSSITLASNANVSTNVTAIIFPWGRGNGTTTFNVPDLRGFAIAGNNNMGGVASSQLNTTYFGATDPNSIGAAGGSQSRVLLSANLPPYTPVGTVAGTVSYANPLVTIVGGGSQQFTGGGASLFGNITGPSYISATFTGTAQGGTSTAFSIIQPTKTSNYIIKITPDTNSATASGVTSLGGMTGDIACGAGLLCTGNTISVTTGVSGPGVTTVGHVALWDDTIGKTLSDSDILSTAFSQTTVKGGTIAFKEGTSTVGGFGVQNFGASTFVLSPNGTNVRFAVSNTSAQLSQDNIPLGADQYGGSGSVGSGITWKSPCAMCNGTIVGGSGGTPGTYTGVALTGGTGTGATASITVSGGGVTAVWVGNNGNGAYVAGDVLSAASGDIGSTVGFSYTLVDGGSDASVISIGAVVSQANPSGGGTLTVGGNYNHGTPFKIYTDTCDNPQVADVACGSINSRFTVLGNVPDQNSMIGIGLDTPTSNYIGTVAHIHSGVTASSAMVHFTTLDKGGAIPAGNVGSYVGYGTNGDFYAAQTLDNNSNIVTQSNNITVTQIIGNTGSGCAVGPCPMFYYAPVVNLTPGSNTTIDGLKLHNLTAASSGNQQYSPSLLLSGNGWKTNATAASQDVSFRINTVPVQGTANPSGNLTFSSQINEAGYSDRAVLTSSGVFTTGGFIGAGSLTATPSQLFHGTASAAGAITATIQLDAVNTSSGETHTGKYSASDNNAGTVRALFQVPGSLNAGVADQGRFDVLVENGTINMMRVTSTAAGTGTVLNLFDRVGAGASRIALNTVGNSTFNGGGILSSHATGGIGYATGAGGAITQITSRTTGVTLNTVSGAITLFSAAGSTTPTSFTVTNSSVAATDTIHLAQRSGADKYNLLITAVAAGSFQVTFFTTGGTTVEQPIFNFAVIKGVAS